MDFVVANGVRFAYLTAGKGPLVLLLHGFPDTAHTWDRVMPELAAAGFHAVAPFMRGYHPTEIPKNGAYDPDTLGRDAIGLIEALGAEHAIVVGHDWGAIAAYSAASQAPHRVSLLVTLGIPHPRSVRPTPRLVWTMRHFFVLRTPRGGERLRANNFAYLDELWQRWSPSWRSLPAAETAHAKESLREPGSAEAAAAYYAAFGPRRPASLRDPITVPTIAFAGVHDGVPHRWYERARRSFTSSYEVVQVPGGHFMHREHPQDFNIELLRAIHDKASIP